MFWTLLIKEFGFCSEELRKPLKVFKHLSTLHLLFEVVYELEPRQGETGQEAVVIVQEKVMKALDKGSEGSARGDRAEGIDCRVIQEMVRVSRTLCQMKDKDSSSRSTQSGVTVKKKKNKEKTILNCAHDWNIKQEESGRR